MKDIEQRLRDMHLAGPSADLDHRLSKMFGAVAQSTSTSRSPVSWWRLLVLVGAGAAVVFVLIQLTTGGHQTEPLVIRIEAQGQLRQLLLEPPSGANNPPCFQVNGSNP